MATFLIGNYNLRSQLSLGQVYVNRDTFKRAATQGDELLETIRQGGCTDSKIRDEVRAYLEEHGKAIGAGGDDCLSERRLAFWEALDCLATNEIATKLEALLVEARKLYSRLQLDAAAIRGESMQ